MVGKFKLWNIIIKLLKTGKVWIQDISIAIVIFDKCKLPDLYSGTNILIASLFFIIVFGIVIVIHAVLLYFRNSISVKGDNYSIEIKYGNLFKMHNCKKVIPFDECFTTTVGELPADINSDSICGQYLKKNPMHDVQMQELINRVDDLKPVGKSEYKNKDRYDSGRLVPNGEYLLMAFAKLDKAGLGELSRSQFINCLTLLWEEIDKYYGQKDVCIPILGSGVTRMESNLLTQQELLDIIIWSYQLSARKIKTPLKLYIVCKKKDDFSLNNVYGAI